MTERRYGAYMDIIASVINSPELKSFRAAYEHTIEHPTEAKQRNLFKRLYEHKIVQDVVVDTFNPVWNNGESHSKNRLTQELNEAQNVLQRLIREIDIQYEHIQNLEEKLFLTSNPKNSENAVQIKKLFNYIVTSDNITLNISKERQCPIVQIKAPLIYFNEKDFQTREDIIKALRNFHFSESEENIDLLEELFINKNLVLWFKNTFYLKNAIHLQAISDTRNANQVQNPHVAIDCWGGHGQAIAKCVETNNLIVLLEQARGAMMNVNTRDTMFPRMLSQLLTLNHDTEVFKMHGREEFISWNTYKSLRTQNEK